MSRNELAPGTVLGGFVVEHLIGAGGMASVYQARQPGFERPVALKVLVEDPEADPVFARRFEREAGVMRALEHPAVLPVYAAGQDHNRLYLAMKLVTGTTPSLADLLSTRSLDVDESLVILRAIASALDHIHSRGVIHRDVKPANILVDPDGAPFLADFGIAKEIGAAVTQLGRSPGTPRYMAPEQSSGGQLGHRTDIYSLACVAFEMLVGCVPFGETDTVPLAIAHATRPIPRATALNPDLPRGLDAVLMRGLAKNPAERHGSARALVSDLDSAFTTTKPRRRRARASSRRTRLIVASCVAALGASIIVGTGGLRTTGSTETTAVATERSFRAAPTDYAAVPLGPLIYSAAMNGTPTGFVDSPSTQPSSAREAIRYAPGGLELELYRPGGETYSEVDLPQGITTFAGEMDLTVRPGSDVELCWSLRWAVPNQLANYLCLASARSEIGFQVFRRGEGKQALGAPVVLPEIGTGAPLHLRVLVREHQLSLYVGGRLVIDVPNDELPPSETLPGVELESETGTGAVRIEGLRLYALGAAA